jgi:hypothetical protein
MNAVFKKLNFKDQSPIFVLHAPLTFNREVDDMRTETEIKTSVLKFSKISFVIAFVTKQRKIDSMINLLAPLLEPDGLLWFAYPKGSSKKYSCDFNRDNGWQELGKLGFEGVRMVSIDEDWTALRFRRAEHIKTMTRSFAMSETGKRKVRVSRSRKSGN